MEKILYEEIFLFPRNLKVSIMEEGYGDYLVIQTHYSLYEIVTIL